MWTEAQWMLLAATTAALAATAPGCSKDESKPQSTPAPSAVAAPTPSAIPAPPPAASSAPAPVASASAPVHDCPKGTVGDGTFAKPCEAKGGARMMEVTWTGKMDEKGPSFRVTNKSTSPILYGKIAVYFYDKAGKQLDAVDPSASAPKPRPYHTCSGAMFGGVMNAGEKAVITFSCVSKRNVPEGVAAIEAEMQTVGFADSNGKTIEYYWRNSDLAPDTRKKSGKK